jgi:hypothetical protein
MTKVKLPEIPKGKLKKVYVLSDLAAKELFNDSNEFVYRHWPFSEGYIVPSLIGNVSLSGAEPFIRLPTPKGNGSEIGIGSYQIGLGINYESSNSSFRTGAGSGILQFLCESEKIDNIDYQLNSNERFNDRSRIITPRSNIFIFEMFKPYKIHFPPNLDGLINKETKEEMNLKVENAYKKILDGIEESMKKRSAVITRGWLNYYL